jgi:hypothetical protein
MLTFSNTNSIVFLLCKVLSKVLICGALNPVVTDTCEVINLDSSETTCRNLPYLPSTLYAAIGGLGLQKNPIICGGWQDGVMSSRCFTLQNSKWDFSFNMSSVRSSAAAVQLLDGKILVTGGWNGIASLNSAELLTEQGWESNIPSLPVSIYGHCMAAVNSTTVMVIGGLQSGQNSETTFYFTFGKERWDEGPKLKYKRYLHSCGKIRRNNESQEMSIIVAGGEIRSSSLSSVEILDEGSNQWKTGPELPLAIFVSQMIEDQNGGVALIGGESSSGDNLDILFKLQHGGKDAVWTRMKQKLKDGRRYHTAFLVPDNIVDCS